MFTEPNPIASAILASIKAAFIQAIVVIIVVVFSVILLYFIVSKYLSPLAAIQTGLTSFFDFINHKTKNVSTIEVKSNDEFGQISNAINENILATKRGLEQDNQAVKESVETVHVVEGGNLTARITANPRNPQLIELKNVLNSSKGETLYDTAANLDAMSPNAIVVRHANSGVL